MQHERRLALRDARRGLPGATDDHHEPDDKPHDDEPYGDDPAPLAGCQHAGDDPFAPARFGPP
jgi:hypothetical protein